MRRLWTVVALTIALLAIACGSVVEPPVCIRWSEVMRSEGAGSVLVCEAFA